jgi:hypothetical protein
MVYLFDVVKNPAYRDSWRGLLRSAGPLPAWIATFDGPSSPMPSIPFDDNIYQLGQECKAHDCADNQIYVLFAPRGVRAWGLLIEAGRQIRWLGHPDDPIRRKLAAAAELYSGH